MNHKQKIKIAKKLIGRGKAPLFNNPMWNERRESIAKRVANKQGKAHKRALARKKQP